ncbi:MAG: hypothetical protein KKF16_06200 [Euryarchaeota archaeon]|nr:hypothetical protein [Euryarchaeota archaeon]MBU4608107.1 hypothetical protein [Euryarchaeota archaeon]MBV1730491.1 hypothetical protein [Methanobacterium sp.]MBV1754228.1 hypothetical protein [Methanobacterium sp.]
MKNKVDKKRFDYFCSPVNKGRIIKAKDWEKMTPEERKKALKPRKI